MAKEGGKSKIKPGRSEYLAADQTILANERTYLAYIRTALTLFVAGVSFLKFFDSLYLHIAGWLFIPLGALTFAVGQCRYLKVRSIVHTLRTNIEESKPQFPSKDH